jgi:hypothetical protein
VIFSFFEKTWRSSTSRHKKLDFFCLFLRQQLLPFCLVLELSTKEIFKKNKTKLEEKRSFGKRKEEDKS